MGMFDNIFIKSAMLPVSDEEMKVIGDNPGWQTKDFDCILRDIEITDTGRLIDRSYPTVLITYTGSINFYCDIGNDWYEFDAKFKKGKLKRIIGGKRDYLSTI